jgi:hypothetical protein
MSRCYAPILLHADVLLAPPGPDLFLSSHPVSSTFRFGWWYIRRRACVESAWPWPTVRTMTLTYLALFLPLCAIHAAQRPDRDDLIVRSVPDPAYRVPEVANDPEIPGRSVT